MRFEDVRERIEMIMLKKRELAVTYSYDQRTQIMQALENANIRCKVHTRKSRVHGSTQSENEYVLYVHPSDEDAARAAIERMR